MEDHIQYTKRCIKRIENSLDSLYRKEKNRENSIKIEKLLIEKEIHETYLYRFTSPSS